jgi:hypothetical protein
MTHCVPLKRWTLIAAMTAVLPALARATDDRSRSPLAGVKELAKPVTYSETKIPLGELVARVAADTGVTLTATPGVSDEPVAVVVKEMPARELLEQLAELLDYQWMRHSSRVRSAYSVSDKGGPAFDAAGYEIHTTHSARTPVLEIYQDLAGKQREAALRSARAEKTVRQFQEEIQSYVHAASLSPERMQGILDEQERQREEMSRMTPEQRKALVSSPAWRQSYEEFQAAFQLWSPVSRALARLLGRLSPRQWGVLREQGRLIFSTDPQAGGAAPGRWSTPLPEEIARAFRAARPMMHRPGAPSGARDPEEDARMRQYEAARQAEWAAADGYQVTIRMDLHELQQSGFLSLTADAGAIRSGTPAPGSLFGSGTSLQVRTRADELPATDEEDTPQRQAALEKDPVVGVRKSFKPVAKQRHLFGPGGPTGWSFRDLLPDVARTYDVQILSDAYANTQGGFQTPGTLPTEPTALFALLDGLAGFRQSWDHHGRLIRLRDRTWFLDRPKEIPLRLIRRWKPLLDQYGMLPLDECARAAAELTDVQLESLRGLSSELELADYLSNLGGLYHARYPLRLYASLSPAEQQALHRGEAIPVTRMTPAQRPLFLAALQEEDRQRSEPMDLAQWAGGSFSMALASAIRTVEQQGTSTSIRSEPAPASGPAAPSRLPRSGIGTDGSFRQTVMGINFRFDYGSQNPESVGIIAASPS